MLREEKKIEDAKYEAEAAVRNLVRLVGERAAKEHLIGQSFLPF
jgi:hypothetical protein